MLFEADAGLRKQLHIHTCTSLADPGMGRTRRTRRPPPNGRGPMIF